VRGGGRHACLCGDVLHHAIQCADPTLGNPADYDPAQAYRTRLALLEAHADTDTVMLTGHFPGPTAGRIVRHGQAFRFRFEAE
jgi:glyoxylase-like metal-dependent hydrolase (beta-lactamase superfamily II)